MLLRCEVHVAVVWLVVRGRNDGVVDSFELSTRTCGGLCGIVPPSSDILEM